MARPLRMLVQDGWYQVFGQGWERNAILDDDRHVHSGNDQGLAEKRALRRRVEVQDVRSRVEELRAEKWGVLAVRRNDAGRALFLRAAGKRCGVTLREAGKAAGE